LSTATQVKSASSVRALAPLLACGALVELGLVAVFALSFQLTEAPNFTEIVAPRDGRLWRAVLPILAFVEHFHPNVIGPDRTTAATAPILPLAFLLAGLGYVLAIVIVSRSRVPLRVVLGLACVFQVTMLVMPGYYSADAFSYAMYGRLAAIYGLNPYVNPPAAAAADLIMPWVTWRDLVSPYGPLWTDVSWALAAATHAVSPMTQVFAYKLLMNAVHLTNVVLVWWLLGQFTSDLRARIGGLVLFAWNPLVLLETAGSAHNDELMVLLLLLAFVPLARLASNRRSGAQNNSAHPRRVWRAWLLALACVFLAILVKYLPVFVALAVSSAWLAQKRGWRGRARVLAAAILLGLALGGLLSLPWLTGLSGPGPLTAVLAGGDGHANSLREAAAPWLAKNVIAAYEPTARAAHRLAHSALDALTASLFALYLFWQLRRVWVRHTDGQLDLDAIVEASAGLILAAILLLLIQVLSWYFVTPLALASLLGPRNPLGLLTAALTLTFLPVYYLRHYAIGPDELLAFYVAIPVLIATAAAIWTAWRARRDRSSTSSRLSSATEYST
jgi:hypothetical protein